MCFSSKIIVMSKSKRKKEEGVEDEQRAGNSSVDDNGRGEGADGDVKASDTDDADYKHLEESWDREMYS